MQLKELSLLVPNIELGTVIKALQTTVYVAVKDGKVSKVIKICK